MVSRLVTGGNLANGSRPTASARNDAGDRGDDRLGGRIRPPPRRGSRAAAPGERAVRRRGGAFVADLASTKSAPGCSRSRAAPTTHRSDSAVHSPHRRPHLLARRPRRAPARRFATADRRGARRRRRPGVGRCPSRHRSGPWPPAAVDRGPAGRASRASRCRPLPAVFVPTRNPYRGLEAFEQADADDFFGRDPFRGRDGRRARHEPLLIVVGPSGSASRRPSRPACCRRSRTGDRRAPRMLVTELVPGREPFENLAAALPRRHHRAPDVVGELLSASCPPGAVVEELAPGQPRCARRDRPAGGAVHPDGRRRRATRVSANAGGGGAHAELVGSARRHAARGLLRRPLAHPGFDDASAAAPSRSARCRRTRWPTPCGSCVLGRCPGRGRSRRPDRRRSGAATGSVAACPAHPLRAVPDEVDEHDHGRRPRRAGGVSGAIGRRADQIYQSFDERHRAAVQLLFLRLVSVTEEHGDTRRRVRRTSSSKRDRHRRARCGARRVRPPPLLIFDRDPASRTPTVELAHEAVLSDW